jgi:glycosyltransferase involved in cell wall biosynthesis
VINGFNGFLVDKTNTKEIAERIITIMDNGDLYRDFSENSRKLYDKKFNPEILSKQLLAIYKR